MQYQYNDGVFYAPADGGYRVVPPPVNAQVPSLPSGYNTIQVADQTFYYFGGIFYMQTENGYVVTDAPPGAIVYNLPDGCEQVQADNITYLKYNGAYFQPIQYNGQNAYEVVDIE